jgi:hypothetical protein
MAYDDRRRGRSRERDENGPEWRGDDGFGGGWGNQVPRPHRLGGRFYRGTGEDRDYGPLQGGGWYGPDAADRDYRYGGPGLESEYRGPRVDRAEFGSARSRDAHPISSESNFGYGFGAGMSGREAQLHDPHYAEWRHRQVAEFDRDDDEYRRENQSRFDREFGAWRQRRGEQRAAVGRVKEHMEVIGSDGGHVGKVDCTRGDRIILTRSDEAAGGLHHAIPCAWIERVDDKVVLNIEADDARRRWQGENRSRALFERVVLGRRGRVVLIRSLAGTSSVEE